MRGQSSAEMMILVGAILVAVASLLYLGAGGNEMETVKSAARAGAENAIADIDAEYGCEIIIEEVGFDRGTIKISVAVRSPPPDFTWENFKENIVESKIKDGALKHIYNAVVGFLPESVDNEVKTGYYAYKVEVDAKLVTK